ncbi:predicted protein [Uncinocarpus reesii 1704]|uniref:Uncharacterized protein n=1 Tax=Uncinocarpus reesii (strain UAMH 1704) TaxID=336963 RepID=C4JKU4_UNCRE|nr:uncharacterized protein UREG_00159 [Uncinocarpus reesii 1704]EEP75313.1 predicted protein [Uncinocarpus reesii 1704]
MPSSASIRLLLKARRGGMSVTSSCLEEKTYHANGYVVGASNRVVVTTMTICFRSPAGCRRCSRHASSEEQAIFPCILPGAQVPFRCDVQSIHQRLRIEIFGKHLPPEELSISRSEHRPSPDHSVEALKQMDSGRLPRTEVGHLETMAYRSSPLLTVIYSSLTNHNLSRLPILEIAVSDGLEDFARKCTAEKGVVLLSPELEHQDSPKESVYKFEAVAYSAAMPDIDETSAQLDGNEAEDGDF